jgi:flagellar biosynthesis protein FliP
MIKTNANPISHCYQATSPVEPEPHTCRCAILDILLPAFVTSELKTAFQIGFMIFLPFLIID